LAFDPDTAKLFFQGEKAAAFTMARPGRMPVACPTHSAIQSGIERPAAILDA
jgi:hypothetical protein